MFNLSTEGIIILVILAGFLSATIASIIGLGGGLIAIPLIMLIIGEHSTEAKLISYASIAALSIMAVFKYWKQKRKPDYKSALLILLGVLPVTVVAEIFISPFFEDEKIKDYFHILYGAVAILATLLINFKDKIKVKKLPNWSLPLVGMSIGVLTGSIGLSGGVIFMPLLVVGLKKDLKEAAVTSLVLKLGVSLMNIIAALSVGQYQAFESHGVYWYLPLIIIVGSLAGAFIGPMFQKKISNKTMKVLFNVVMAILVVWEFTHAALLLTNVM